MKVKPGANPPFPLPGYLQLQCRYDPKLHALWCYLNPKPRPSFTPVMLAELSDLQKRLSAYMNSGDVTAPIDYFIYASVVPGIFSSGGDIDLFVRLISERDWNSLRDYGRLCVELVLSNYNGFGVSGLTTISLVQGSALGGGFECALSCHKVIAEKRCQMGFPEIVFNLFPGMGALSFLARRINLSSARRLTENSKILKSDELWKLGVIDVLAPEGHGEKIACEFIRNHRRTANGYLAIRRAVERISPLAHEELLDIVDLWVETALQMSKRDLRVMRRIVAAQNRRQANITVASDKENEKAWDKIYSLS